MEDPESSIKKLVEQRNSFHYQVERLLYTLQQEKDARADDENGVIKGMIVSAIVLAFLFTIIKSLSREVNNFFADWFMTILIFAGSTIACFWFSVISHAFVGESKNKNPRSRKFIIGMVVLFFVLSLMATGMIK